MRLRIALGVASSALLLVGTGTATAAAPLRAHVYAPYFETWTSDSLTTTAQQSGAFTHLLQPFTG
jgi:uncharacterized membrane protein required for colicin V production